MTTPDSGGLDHFDHTVDVLIVGSGGGGMTAALTATARGLSALVVEKSSHFGGSTALSGGGIWVPGAPAQRREGYVPAPEGVVGYLRQITDGLVSEARIRQYVESSPKMLELLEGLPGTARRLRTRQHDQRAAHRSAEVGCRRAEAAHAPGSCSQGNLAGPQRASIVLSDQAVVGRERRAIEADFPDGQGSSARRADSGDRAVAGGPVEAGDAGARYSALAGHADDRTAD